MRAAGSRERGGGPVEMAVMLPLVLLCVFLTAHLCMLYLANQAALSAAQIAVEGERGYQAEPGTGVERADRFLDQVPGVLGDPDVQVFPNEGGERVTAVVTGTSTSIVPWFSHTVSQTASGPVERITEVP